MNKPSLYKKFDTAITWNGILFIFNKVSKTALTFFLFIALTPQDFSIWVNIYSFIFITLLWLNFGFSRSLPQYCLSFAQNNQAKKIFLSGVIIFKILISTAAGSLLYLLFPYLTNILHLPYKAEFLKLGCILFIVEGIKSIYRLIFYSYFWQKRFNFIETAIITIHSVFILLIVSQWSNSTKILRYIFLSDISANIFLIVIASLMFNQLNQDKDYQGRKKINFKRLIKEFSIHSGVMWSLLTVHSITERNFLVPLLTYFLGPIATSVFKVANDGALLFQRFVIKTIGTTGTSLFAHLETGQIKVSENRSNLATNNIFLKLTKRVILLTFIVLGITNIIFLQLKNLNNNILTTFFLLSTLYLFQIIFMSYERLLEVKRNYKYLFISLIPYLIIIALFIFASSIQNLLIILSLIHILRILSLSIRVFYAKKLYLLKFPMRFTITFGAASLVLSTLIHNIFLFFNLNFIAKFAKIILKI